MSLYQLSRTDDLCENRRYCYNITLNPSHAIFQGHFPDQPVLPGVCQMEIIAAIMEIEEKKTLNLVNAKNIKFLKIVDPTKTLELSVEIQVLEKTSEYIRIQSKMESPEGICLKFKGKYSI